MLKRNYTNHPGYTLVEIILAVALISIVIIVSTNLVVFGIKSHKLTVKEYDIQSSIRQATEQTNQILRYSKAVFAVPQTFVRDTDIMDPGWDYFMVSLDGKRIVAMEYNEISDKHEERVLVNEQDNIVYEVFFEKDTTAKTDSVMKYKIYAFTTDNEGKKEKEKLIFESTIESINAIQVADKGTVVAPSIALAYRSDGQTSGKGKNQIAYITIVVDISNSMNQTPTGGGSTSKETNTSRIFSVRKALIDNGSSTGSGIIQLFSREENVFLSLIPFANTANFPTPHANSKPHEIHPIYDVYKKDDATSLITLIKGLKADGYDTRKYGSGNGGTNTGEGLRRAYYLHDNFRAKMNVNPKDQVHHYIIMLVDGETTFESSYFNWEDNGFYIDANKSERISKDKYDQFNWKTDWKSTKNGGLILDGNIDLLYDSSHVPGSDSLVRNKYYNGTINYKEWDRYWSSYNNKSYRGNIVEYGKQNDDFSNILITGNGSTVINNSPYIKSIGTEIKKFDSGNGVKSYIIGYANRLGTHINSIGTDIGTDSKNIYKYDDPGFDLQEIFRNIATDIMADFWLVSGPQIQEPQILD